MIRKRILKQLLITLIVYTILSSNFKSELGALESTEAIAIAEEIAKIEQENEENRKNATKIEFDEDDKAQVLEDKEYLNGLYDKLEKNKTDNKVEQNIIDNILHTKIVRAEDNGIQSQAFRNEAIFILRNLPIDTAIQKTYYDGQYIYALQRDDNDMLLSRYNDNGQPVEIDKDTGRSESMRLVNFGHSQSLEKYTYNGKTYFWISCGVKSFIDDKGKLAVWSTEIARIQFSAGKTLYSDKESGLINLKYADKEGNGKDFGKIKRVDMAMSANGNNIAIWCKDTSGKMRFTIYDNNLLNKALDSKTKRSCNSKDVKKAYIYHKAIKSIKGLVGKSFQGMELTNNLNYYICSGKRSDNKKIVKLKKNADFIKDITLSGREGTLKQNVSEIEGLQIIGDALLYGLCGPNKEGQKQEEQYIYKNNKF